MLNHLINNGTINIYFGFPPPLNLINGNNNDNDDNDDDNNNNNNPPGVPGGFVANRPPIAPPPDPPIIFGNGGNINDMINPYGEGQEEEKQQQQQQQQQQQNNENRNGARRKRRLSMIDDGCNKLNVKRRKLNNINNNNNNNNNNNYEMDDNDIDMNNNDDIDIIDWKLLRYFGIINKNGDIIDEHKRLSILNEIRNGKKIKTDIKYINDKRYIYIDGCIDLDNSYCNLCNKKVNKNKLNQHLKRHILSCLGLTTRGKKRINKKPKQT